MLLNVLIDVVVADVLVDCSEIIVVADVVVRLFRSTLLLLLRCQSISNIRNNKGIGRDVDWIRTMMEGLDPDIVDGRDVVDGRIGRDDGPDVVEGRQFEGLDPDVVDGRDVNWKG